eukprot:CAMPEP_0194422718 /NCGR_PEP_ID=MMETSP0176-20130528/22018_1 /TAXON_ID=216777 /ORGANISM="Proboscia alata, Strain PI-D3" /LENGTH=1134 /DNA_ID=CAMNT_0039231601 /DNA_START=11 /DNA_END=3415 /DNA_ORIENTATION=-
MLQGNIDNNGSITANITRNRSNPSPIATLRQSIRLIHCLQKERGCSCAASAAKSVDGLNDNNSSDDGDDEFLNQRRSIQVIKSNLDQYRHDTDAILLTMENFFRADGYMDQSYSNFCNAALALRDARKLVLFGDTTAINDNTSGKKKNDLSLFNKVFTSFNKIISILIHDRVELLCDRQQNNFSDATNFTRNKKFSSYMKNSKQLSNNIDGSGETKQDNFSPRNNGNHRKDTHDLLFSEEKGNLFFSGRDGSKLSSSPSTGIGCGMLSAAAIALSSTEDMDTNYDKSKNKDHINAGEEEHRHNFHPNRDGGNNDNTTNSQTKQSALLSLLLAFMQLKEASGTERAFLYGILVSDWKPTSAHSSDMLNDMVINIENQHRMIGDLNNMAKSMLWEGYSGPFLTIIEDSIHPTKEMKRLHNIIRDNFDFESFRNAVTGGEFWKLVTLYIDKLHSLELLMLEDLEYVNNDINKNTTHDKELEKGNNKSILDMLIHNQQFNKNIGDGGDTTKQLEQMNIRDENIDSSCSTYIHPPLDTGKNQLAASNTKLQTNQQHGGRTTCGVPLLSSNDLIEMLKHGVDIFDNAAVRQKNAGLNTKLSISDNQTGNTTNDSDVDDNTRRQLYKTIQNMDSHSLKEALMTMISEKTPPKINHKDKDDMEQDSDNKLIIPASKIQDNINTEDIEVIDQNDVIHGEKKPIATTLTSLSSMTKPTTLLLPKEWEIGLYEVKFKKRIGRGVAGTTYLGTWQGADETVAIKVAMMSDMGVEGWLKEVETLQRLHHPNIIRLLGCINHVEPPTKCLVLEYCDSGDLTTVLRVASTPSNFFWGVASGIAKGIAYLHSRGVMHRDIKPDNILLHGNLQRGEFTVKVTDFGVSVVSHDDKDDPVSADRNRTAETGTYRWMAPEILRHEIYSSRADVYSFALVVWQLITREEPFAPVSQIEAAGMVALENSRPPFPKQTPAPIIDFISRCWHDDPHERPSSDMLDTLLAVLEKPSKNGNTKQIVNSSIKEPPSSGTNNANDKNNVIPTIASLTYEEQFWLSLPMGHPVYLNYVKGRKTVETNEPTSNSAKSDTYVKSSIGSRRLNKDGGDRAVTPPKKIKKISSFNKMQLQKSLLDGKTGGKKKNFFTLRRRNTTNNN